MTLENLKELFREESQQRIPITHKRIAIFETISAHLTQSDKLVLTYNTKSDHLKIQLSELTEVFELENLQAWLLRQRILSLAIETNVPINIIEDLTRKWEEH